MTAQVGLAVGRGTGPELADVFERVVNRLGQLHGVAPAITRSPRVYHSYFSLRAEADGIADARRLTEDDAGHYERFCRSLARRGGAAVFRTAVNAQSLYLVRQRLRAVKVDVISAPGSSPDAALLLVRDEAQGFYTGENRHTPGVLTRTMQFSREITDDVIAHALAQGWRQWPDGGADRIVMAYKHHLLDGAFDDWVRAAAERHRVRIELNQPDTVNRNLIQHGVPRRTVVVAGNEWGDIMHVVLLDRYGGDKQENRCSENVYLHPELAGLVEYQTVHGSADDLAGRDTVNPVATVRAAAAVVERHCDGAGAIEAAERALAAVTARGVLTPDLGGRHSTTAVVDALLAELPPGRVERPARLEAGS
ncbi:isocitrate dehydrogenase [Saccharothrix sp. 6-C]|uniref:isocitrate/isopropylmalate family dehydrogenase n=1 Tax=Saccharothrix sp. 6-C TaxID=2781735 RepID=UPI001916CE66|nr:isocitrate/isopropylmalate family dehydrogenase [Saccharothrix sp. 6-C]QQQ74119.1 isocitrate dehydrogenase [Saccharothrix sp. 6-C]